MEILQPLVLPQVKSCLLGLLGVVGILPDSQWAEFGILRVVTVHPMQIKSFKHN